MRELGDHVGRRIRRARPKFLGPASAGASSAEEPLVPETLYFNRGSSALKFALSAVAEMLGRRPVVCMQSFNCSTVLAAALEAGAEVVLSDIKVSDLSMPLDFARKNGGRFDVLLLLHYQGQRNEEHAEIADWCAENAVMLIEDLAHCPDHEWPLLGDLGLTSYAFDKPFCCMHGGALVRGRVRGEIWTRLAAGHEALPAESKGKEMRELRLLDFLMEYSAPDSYRGGDGPVLIIQALQALRIPKPLLASLLRRHGFSMMMKLLEFLLARIRQGLGRPKFTVSRLGHAKVALLRLQRRYFAEASSGYEVLARQLASAIEARYGVAPQPISGTTNRITVMCSSRDIKPDMAGLGIEAGNFNWPIPLHLLSRSRHVRAEADFTNSEYACRHVVNVPAWSAEALERLRNEEVDANGWCSA